MSTSTALKYDSSLEEIAEAENRIRALPEGRAMIDFMYKQGYDIEFMDELDSVAAHDLVKKKIYFRSDADADTITAFLPHEIFHAMQFENLPEMRNFAQYTTRNPDYKPALLGDVLMPEPSEYLFALNMMEIAAHAVSTDFVCRLASEAGDHAARRAYECHYPDMVDCYDKIFGSKDLPGLRSCDRMIANFRSVTSLDPNKDRARAATAAALHWFWQADLDTGPARLHYNDSTIELLEDSCRRRLAPIFNLAGSGAARPAFAQFDRSDILKLGEGYSFNPLNVPGFEDMMSPDYRNEISEDNKRRLRNVEATFGIA
jgi:hypothetical protein